ncbi:hypothetical protein [Tissierella sp.]|uniref:hypothetical protein n=1 Tax=Tissierella sp. TaxID=41274 RepID=UPI003026F47A
MLLLNKIFRRDPGLKAVKKLEKLDRKLMDGLSEDKDLIEWEKNLKILIDTDYTSDDNPWYEELRKTCTILEGINKSFNEYLIKHYPNDVRLKLRLKGNQDVDTIRQGMYRNKSK